MYWCRHQNVIATLAASALSICVAQSAFASAKNVILMISDGQGFNTVQATDYFTGTKGVYEGFTTKFAMQTTSANNPSGYNPGLMASDSSYSLTGATDSASAATAMYTGVKNYDGAINWSTSGSPLTTFF